MADAATMGECIVELHQAHTPGEHAVVTRADTDVLASVELVTQWFTGQSPHVDVQGRTVTFGTEGKGLGRVTYEIGDQVRPPQMPEEPVVALRRLR